MSLCRWLYKDIEFYCFCESPQSSSVCQRPNLPHDEWQKQNVLATTDLSPQQQAEYGSYVCCWRNSMVKKAKTGNSKRQIWQVICSVGQSRQLGRPVNLSFPIFTPHPAWFGPNQSLPTLNRINIRILLALPLGLRSLKTVFMAPENLLHFTRIYHEAVIKRAGYLISRCKILSAHI